MRIKILITIFGVVITVIKTFNSILLNPTRTKSIIHSIQELSQYKAVKSYKDIEVVGNTGNIPLNHPVISLVKERWRTNSKPGKRNDSKKIALVIEGGGMRGCVSAGATAALNFLGLNDAIDIVYGSSAGAMVGAYFISRQSSGIEIYYDYLPAAGRKFIKKTNLINALGLLSHPITYEHKPVFNLDFLLKIVMSNLMSIDWNTFIKNESIQPLRIMTSSLDDMTPLILSKENNNYHDLSSLLDCIRISMAVPGITGNLLGIHKKTNRPTSIPIDKSNDQSFIPLVDAFLCEPIPYRSACEEGATHIIALRTRPDPCKVLGSQPGIFENIISKKYFMKYNHLNAIDWMINMRHNRVYAEDILRLNEASLGLNSGVTYNNKNIHILPIAPQYCKEVNQLENKREVILQGVVDGAKRVLELFLPSLLDLNNDQLLTDRLVNDIIDMIFPLKSLNGKVFGDSYIKLDDMVHGLQHGQKNT